MMKLTFVPILLITAVVALVFLLQSCSVKPSQSSSRPITHELWGQLVKEHVDEAGWVNYEGFARDSNRLNNYLDLLGQHHPNDQHWSKEEQLAYWINAYNAFTVQLVMRNLPVKSIKDIKKGLPFINSVWDISFINIEEAIYDLNNIEHGILRKHFDEPRIHFAINCASYSCPPLLNEAYTAQQLEAQLSKQARAFISDTKRNIIQKDKLQLSKIFKWFKGDFTKQQSLIEFINQYAATPISKDAEVTHLDYIWTINSQAKNATDL